MELDFIAIHMYRWSWCLKGKNGVPLSSHMINSGSASILGGGILK